MSEENNDNSDKKFKDPELAINRVYTRRGDSGTTQLVGGHTVSKTSDRIEAYGTVDELNATIGAARQVIMDDYAHDVGYQNLARTLLRVQHELFNLGSVLATLPEDVGEQMPRVTEADVRALEESIDEYNRDLPELRSFVLPGGSRLNVELHRARTICRRAERGVIAVDEAGGQVNDDAIAYLNRLSDALFVWGRWVVAVHDHRDEVLWDPNLSSGSQSGDNRHEGDE